MSSMSSVLCPRWKHWQRSRYINPCAVMWQVAVTVGRGPVIVWYWMCVSMLSAYYAAPSMVLAEAVVVGSMKLFLVRGLPSGVQLREPDWVSVPGSAHRCSPPNIFMDANVDNVGSGGQNTSDMEHRQNKHPSWSTGIFHLCSTTTLAFIIPCFCQYMQVRLCPGHVEFHYCDSRLDFDEWLHHNVHSRYKTRREDLLVLPRIERFPWVIRKKQLANSSLRLWTTSQKLWNMTLSPLSVLHSAN